MSSCLVVRLSLRVPYLGHCRTTVGRNIHSLLEQTGLNFTVGQSVASDEKRARQSPVRHDTVRGCRHSLSVVREGLYVTVAVRKDVATPVWIQRGVLMAAI